MVAAPSSLYLHSACNRPFYRLYLMPSSVHDAPIKTFISVGEWLFRTIIIQPTASPWPGGVILLWLISHMTLECQNAKSSSAHNMHIKLHILGEPQGRACTSRLSQRASQCVQSSKANPFLFCQRHSLNSVSQQNVLEMPLIRIQLGHEAELSKRRARGNPQPMLSALVSRLFSVDRPTDTQLGHPLLHTKHEKGDWQRTNLTNLSLSLYNPQHSQHRIVRWTVCCAMKNSAVPWNF